MTFVASLDSSYMTSERIGELLSTQSKEAIETEIGYKIYDGETSTEVILRSLVEHDVPKNPEFSL